MQNLSSQNSLDVLFDLNLGLYDVCVMNGCFEIFWIIFISEGVRGEGFDFFFAFLIMCFRPEK